MSFRMAAIWQQGRKDRWAIGRTTRWMRVVPAAPMSGTGSAAPALPGLHKPHAGWFESKAADTFPQAGATRRYPVTRCCPRRRRACTPGMRTY
ncbi:hypothetical protein, partial [Paenibacillus jilunlii]|uniref:hypothetical protein n=1 Tax=Paenibacillus jilunlii TaxID=682956 RepID=UPI001B802C0B